MNKFKILLIVLVSIGIFLLVYCPHYHYRFPSHIDEWHHITEAMRLEKGIYPFGVTGYEMGFHALLALLSKFANLVLIYRFLPAIWAVVSALVLFYVVYSGQNARYIECSTHYKKTSKFNIALLAMIFFASIKSNVNILGLWFFTPLTFSIPFIFLYVYFFTEGLEKKNKKYLLISLAIMVLLLPIYPISFFFAIPFLLIYSLFNLEFIKKEWKFFLIFLLIPLSGIFFYKYESNFSWPALMGKFLNSLQFKRGWGIVEMNNSPFELYSLMGYVLAVWGLILIFINKIYLFSINKINIKKYLAYALWPVSLLLLIIIFKVTGVSYLSPYQRNLYYLAISLPLLSAIGLENLIQRSKMILGKISISLIVVMTIGLSFLKYFYVPEKVALYQMINEKEYQALLFLKNIPEEEKILVVPRMAGALFPVSGHSPIGEENRQDMKTFFSLETDTQTKQEILKKYQVNYIFTDWKIDGPWNLIYEDGSYIYKIN